MQRDDTYLIDILESAKLAINYVSGMTKDEFITDSKCQDAVIRRLEVIGEAAGNVSAETRAKHNQVPWQTMIGMRNILIHVYGDVDLIIVWGTVQTNLPDLVDEIEKML